MLERKPHVLLVAFLTVLAALNVWRLNAWGFEGVVRYLSDPIVQTTWFDFACVLAILLVFIHRDARKHGLTYWWILPTFPFMPTIGLLAYFIVRRRALLAKGAPLVATALFACVSVACARVEPPPFGPVARPVEYAPRVSERIGSASPTKERTQRLAQLLKGVCVGSAATDEGMFCEGEPKCEWVAMTTLANDMRRHIYCQQPRGAVLSRFGEIRHITLEWNKVEKAPCVVVESEVKARCGRECMLSRYCHESPSDREQAEMTWRLLAEIADVPFDTEEEVSFDRKPSPSCKADGASDCR